MYTCIFGFFMFWVRSEGFGFIGYWMSFTLRLTDYHAPNSCSIPYTTILMVIDVPLWMSLHFAHFRYTIILSYVDEIKKCCWWWWRRRFMITMMVTVLLRENGFCIVLLQMALLAVTRWSRVTRSLRHRVTPAATRQIKSVSTGSRSVLYNVQ